MAEPRATVAIIGGSGIAGLTKGSSALIRAKSGLMTGGLGNPVVSTAETIGATGLSLFAIALPLVALVLIVVLVGTLVYGAQSGLLWAFVGGVASLLLLQRIAKRLCRKLHCRSFLVCRLWSHCRNRVAGNLFICATLWHISFQFLSDMCHNVAFCFL